MRKMTTGWVLTAAMTAIFAGAPDAQSQSIDERASALEADAARIRAGELGGDSDRMAKLAGVLRQLAMQ